MKLLLDNCIINKLFEDEKVLKLLRELKSFKVADYYICHSVIEEIAQTPDKNKEKRIEMLHMIFELEPKVLNDDVAVFDFSRFDYSRFGTGEVFQNILSKNKGNVRDAIHAETAVANGLILVTEDIGLYNAMKLYNYDVFNLGDLKNSKNITNENYPILKQEYKHGFVCYFDILGFGSFSMNASNLQMIKNAIAKLQNLIRNHRMNSFIGEITMFSDCIFFTVENKEMKETIFLTSILDFVCLARDMIQMDFGTDIRAGLSYGEFIHLASGEIYGPAVTQAVRLAEPKKKNDILSGYLKSDPAAIIIHRNVFESPLNENKELELLFQSHPERYVPIGDTEFYYVNPYYFIFETKGYTAILFGEKLNKTELCKIWKSRILANKEHQEKYSIALKMLSDFETDESTNT